MSEKTTNGDGKGKGGRGGRKRIRRNAWWLAAVAAAVYLGYLWYVGTLGAGG